MADPLVVTDGLQATQQAQKDPIVRSPTSTVADDDVAPKADAAALAAAYRARIALAAASPASGTVPINHPRGTPTARLLTFVNSPLHTPTVHGNDQNTVHSLEKKWRTLYSGLKSNSQAAADVLMKQAQATSQLEELTQALFMQLKAGTEDRARLQQLLLQERAQLMAQVEEAQQMQQRLHKSEHRSTAVQVVTESLQSQLSQTRDALEVSNRERQHLAEQVKQLQEQLAVTTECRTRGDALLSEQTTIIETLRQQLEEQASTVSSLAEDKAQLEAQMQGVLRAEQELTVHLRETHAAIEGQLMALREQLKTERQKRAAVVKRRGELQAQVEQLQAQVAAQQADIAALTERLSRGGASHAVVSRAAPTAVAGHPVVPAAPKPTVLTGAHPRPASAAGTTHVVQSRGAAGLQSAGAAAAAAAAAAAGQQQRPRPALRSSVSVPNPKLTSHSPTVAGGGSAGRLAAQRRISSPTGAVQEEAPGTAITAPGVTFHVPSALPSPEASFAVPPMPASAMGSDESPSQATGRHVSTPAVNADGAYTRYVVHANPAVEPPSPPITLMSARENTASHIEHSSTGANRRRSVSPDASRASVNAAQHARRVVSAAARSSGSRATSPAPTLANNTWLP